MSLWYDLPLLVVDTETTSKYPTEAAIRADRKATRDAHPARVIQLGTCTVDRDFDAPDGYRVKHGNAWVNPGRDVPADVIEAIKLTPDELSRVKAAGPFRRWAPQLADAMEWRTVVGYNILAYDLPVLEREFRLCEVPMPKVAPIDVLIWASHLLEGLPDFKLGTVAEACGVDVVDAHRAGGDCLMTWRILERLKPDLPGELPALLERQAFLAEFGSFWAVRMDGSVQLNCTHKSLPKGTPWERVDKADGGFVNWTMKLIGPAARDYITARYCF